MTGLVDKCEASSHLFGLMLRLTPVPGDSCLGMAPWAVVTVAVAVPVGVVGATLAGNVGVCAAETDDISCYTTPADTSRNMFCS